MKGSDEEKKTFHFVPFEKRALAKTFDSPSFLVYSLLFFIIFMGKELSRTAYADFVIKKEEGRERERAKNYINETNLPRLKAVSFHIINKHGKKNTKCVTAYIKFYWPKLKLFFPFRLSILTLRWS